MLSDVIGTTPNYANFTIRGIGINSSIPSIDPTVGVFVDGVYLGINSGVVLDQFDLESIEVLRGPQGILFGRNVTGGAVLINTKSAPDEFEVSLKGAVDSGFRGTGPRYFAMGSVGGPVIDGVLNAKVAAYYQNDNGWQKRYTGDERSEQVAQVIYGSNPATAPALPLILQNERDGTFVNHGASQTWIVRPSILFTPTETLELELRYEHGEAQGDGPSAQNHTNGLGQTNPFFSAPRDTFDFSIDEPGFFEDSWDQVIAEVNWDVAFGDGTITNIFGWRDYTSSSASDIDSTPLFLFHSRAGIDQDQISNELRYAGRFFDRMDLTAGFYYFSQTIAYDEQRFLLGGASRFFGGGQQDQVTYGGFAQLDFDITDSFILNVGARYTFEKKQADVANLVLNSTTFSPSPECSVIAGTCPFDFSDEESWGNFNPKIGFQWTVSELANVYGSYTQGNRSGGYNFRNTSLASVEFLPNPAPPPALVPNPAFDPLFQPGPFDEENVDAFELGLKASPIPGAVVNAAFFYNIVSDMQREINLADPVTGVVQIITNTADATIWGFEIDTQVPLGDRFLWTGFLGFTNGEYDEIRFDLTGDGVIDRADFALKIPRISPFSYGTGLIFSQPLGDLGTANARVNYSHRDRNFYTDNNLGVLNAVDIVDASVAWTTYEDRVTLSVYGQNLLNEVNFGGDTQLPGSLGAGTFSPLARGRTIGLEVQLNF